MRRVRPVLSRVPGAITHGCLVNTVMKWFVIVCLLLRARHGEGGALKCVSGSDDVPCSPEQQEIEVQDIVSDTSPSPVGSRDAECLAGSEWESNCHACRCSADGVAGCQKLGSCTSPLTEPIRCKPNTTFHRECNTCTCLENGLGLCTLMGCHRIPVTAPVPSKENLPLGQDCAPGSEWKSGCSSCVCTPEGLRSCSSKECPEDQDSEPLLRCAPHSLWKKECNTCWCTSDGRAMCTKIACLGIPSDMHFSDEQDDSETKEIAELDEISKIFKDVKPEETSWNNDPSTDRDANNLTGITLKELEDFSDNNVKTFKEDLKQKHEEGLGTEELKTPFPKRGKRIQNYSILKKLQESRETYEANDEADKFIGNELKEVESSYLNHLRPDTESNGESNDLEVLEAVDRNVKDMHRIIKRSVCKPNEDFQNDCNTCKCSATGESYACTQNECMDSDKEDVDKEVEVFMKSEGEDHVEQHSVCKPSSTFFVGCNPCQCNADGTDFSCTSKPCPLPEDVEVFHELNEMKPIVPLKSGETTNRQNARKKLK